MALYLAKKTLREELKQRLKQMHVENRDRQSQVIFMKLLQNEKYCSSKRISIYLSRDIEVNTEPILKHIFKSGKQCFIPKYDSKTTNMDMVKLKSLEKYKTLPLTSWNIKQPAESTDIAEDCLTTGGLDLMIVPGIGFTKDGLRIGNGKGYYDVYLKKYREIIGKPVYTIALSYREQIVSALPTDENDMKIDEVICPD